MRRHPVALLLAVLVLGIAGCGGDDEESSETVPPGPELSLPGEDVPTLDDLPDTTSTDGSEAEGESGGQPAPPAGGQPTPPAGGQPAPDDSPQNDTPPPPNSPAERFEQFCAENPGAC